MSDYLSNPCPWRIINGSGEAFVMGAVGGSLLYSIQGYRNSPKGFNSKLVSTLAAFKTKSPVLAGHFGVWGGIYSTIECSLIYLRQKDDLWNMLMSGTLSTSVLAARRGVAAMAANAIRGGILFTIIVGVLTIFARIDNNKYKTKSIEDTSF